MRIARNHMLIGLIAATAVAAVGILNVLPVQAGHGYMSGRHHRGGDCWGHPGPGYHCYGSTDGLTREETARLDRERASFRADTRGLRTDLSSKQDALQRELAMDNPNAETAAALQQDISDLQAELDRRWLEHLIAVKKINPDLGRGFAQGGGHGGGPGNGRHCWE